jgi:hypothetical protein
VAPNWLAQFPKSVRSQLHDSFFLEGPSIEVLEALIPMLNQKGSDKDPVSNKICSTAERFYSTIWGLFNYGIVLCDPRLSLQ